MLWEEPCITICCFSVPGSKSKCFWPNKTKNIIPIQHSCSLRGIAFPSQLSNPCFPMHFLPEQNQPNQNRRIVSIKQNSFLPSFCISINLPYLKKNSTINDFFRVYDWFLPEKFVYVIIKISNPELSQTSVLNSCHVLGNLTNNLEHKNVN